MGRLQAPLPALPEAEARFTLKTVTSRATAATRQICLELIAMCVTPELLSEILAGRFATFIYYFQINLSVAQAGKLFLTAVT